MDLLSTDFMT